MGFSNLATSRNPLPRFTLACFARFRVNRCGGLNHIASFHDRYKVPVDGLASLGVAMMAPLRDTPYLSSSNSVGDDPERIAASEAAG